jgi:hypothetical protein
VNKWGYLNKTKWALVEEAPLTASGLNEILATAETKKQMQAIAECLGFTPRARNWYKIVRLDGIPTKEDA